jgi:hypothetical protein
MKRVALSLVLFSVGIFSIGAEPFQLDNIIFHIKSLPEKDGGGFNADIGYRFSPKFASEVILNNQISAETGEVDLGKDSATGASNAESSLNLDRQSVTEIFILPVEFGLRFGQVGRMDFGVGAYISRQSDDNVGYFKPSSVGMTNYGTTISTNSYNYSVDATFYGPVLTVSSDLDFGFVRFSPKATVVPYFLFNQTSGLSMYPLLKNWGTGSISFDGKGVPYFSVALSDIMFPVGRLVGLNWLSLGGDYAFEFTRQDTKQIQTSGTPSSPTWSGTDVTQSLASVSYLGKLGINLGKNGWIMLGIGAKTVTSSDLTNNTSATVQKTIYSLSYDIKR